MAGLKELKKYNLTRILIMVIAAAVLVGIIVITAVAIISARDNGKLSAQSLISSVVSTEDILIPDDVKGVTKAEKCFDDQGELIAYAVIGYGEGFCGRVSVQCYFDPDGKTLIGIRVVDQIESENYGTMQSESYGAEISDSPFVQRFDYAKMPLWHYEGGGEAPEQDGTRIDVLTGATISSNAVIEAVNTAYTYYTQNIL